MCIVDEIINELKTSLNKNEIFLSEADMQFCFAQIAEKKGATNIILEYPIKTSKLYDGNERVEKSFEFCDKNIDEDKTYIDVKFEYNNEIYFVELKYKTSTLENLTRHGYPNFELFEHGAVNEGLYKIYEDIERMENIISAQCETERYEGKSIKSYILVLTNDCGYWSKHKEKTYIQNVSLNQEFTEMENKNECPNSKGFDFPHISINKKKDEQYGRPICLNHQYKINWKFFKSFPDKKELYKGNRRNAPTTFKYLKIDLRKDVYKK